MPKKNKESKKLTKLMPIEEDLKKLTEIKDCACIGNCFCLPSHESQQIKFRDDYAQDLKILWKTANTVEKRQAIAEQLVKQFNEKTKTDTPQHESELPLEQLTHIVQDLHRSIIDKEAKASKETIDLLLKEQAKPYIAKAKLLTGDEELTISDVSAEKLLGHKNLIKKPETPVTEKGNVKVLPFKRGRIPTGDDNKYKELKRDPIIINEDAAMKYGHDNYLEAISASDPYAYTNKKTNNIGPDPLLYFDPSSIDSINESQINISKKYCQDNKDEMAQIMNVVALYSIKDNKPFYYVSSAEARVALEFISEMRRTKTNIYELRKKAYETTKNVNAKLYEIINEEPLAYTDSYNDITQEIIESLQIVDTYANENFNKIEKGIIFKKIENINFGEKIKITRIAPSENVSEMLDMNTLQVAKLLSAHKHITCTFGYMSIAIVNSFHMGHIIKTTERKNAFTKWQKASENTHGIIANYDNIGESYPIMHNPKLKDNQIVVLSFNISTNESIYHIYELI